jgi:ribosomal protein S1
MKETMGVVLLLVVFMFFLLGVQGLRAFLPRVEFLKHPAPEPNEDLVGTKVWVLITVAEESRGNIILSEVRAWVRNSFNSPISNSAKSVANSSLNEIPVI